MTGHSNTPTIRNLGIHTAEAGGSPDPICLAKASVDQVGAEGPVTQQSVRDPPRRRGTGDVGVRRRILTAIMPMSVIVSMGVPVLHVPFVLWVGAEIERHAEAAVLFLAGQELVRRRQVLLVTRRSRAFSHGR